MSLSSSPTQPIVLASPDRVVFRTLPHPLAATNKRVTLSLRRTTSVPSGQRLFTYASEDSLAVSEPGSAPLNAQSPNIPRLDSTSFQSSNAIRDSNTSPTTPVPSPATIITKNSDDHPAPKISTTPPTPTSPTHKQAVPLLKSGLPIKSALKSSVVADSNNNSLARPSPIRFHSTPNMSSPKFVHFNTQLEHVRLFLQGETPSCIADRETIIDAGQEEQSTSDIKLTLTNWSPVAKGAFKPGNIDAGATPLCVENVELSEDQSELVGTILIQNIAFHKHVSVRYTADFWQTQSEVNAEYKESIPGVAVDRFTFKIALAMEKSIVEKTFCFAVRYQVIGREFWDSNNGMNYQVECKRVVVTAPKPTSSDLSKQMNSILLASQISDYNKPVLKKKTNNRYDLSTSLSAAYSQPISIPSRYTSSKMDIPNVSQTAYRPSEYIAPIQSPPGYQHSLYASSPKFVNPYLAAASPPEHFHIEFDQPVVSKKNGYNSWSSRENDSSVSIKSIQSEADRPQVGSSSYVDLVDRYCFYESSPHSNFYTGYSTSPSTPFIRG
ncbi:hypothetical protein BX616_010900 [Lobosporangium transversale]|uniref:Putative phosphatase regulatory subunit-domain-containing protein n=1 Tax=Lobosporangium transversale TaxID=64571 RepID=A0A1Y2GS62_9FUNG|nr:putative phosphatase regulatory subunit-domain-containing protein [Lobosporangium transversale]KAF9910284.1 hypothetical protein BX616_010900 [Lobosporangium transversale]ORZ20978.1 putative phosphatase regulatory subunit-domain-containing protein [Lobosporangium transversale]|eukprot:XP_021882887.1 putative phosphatase regulatory subunit-domain-containing protein [Lobosporangium transversale]